jgi:outer membrane biosynthesis protein TonB
VRSLALLAVLLPALALAGTITTGPTPEEQAQAAKAQAAKAKPAKKPPAKKPPPKKKPQATKPPAVKAPATQPAPKPALAPEPEDGPPAGPARPSSAKENFRKAYPCPSTGRSSGSCPGYEVEHMNPPACGGADSPGNMQWVQASSARKKGAPECKTR